MRTRSTRPATAEALSWPAVLLTLLVNLLAWTALLLVYQRAARGVLDAPIKRTPIAWLKPVAQAQREPATTAPPQTRTRSRVAAVTKTRTDSAAPLDSASTPVAPAAQLSASNLPDDDWQSGKRGQATATDNAGPVIAYDPLRLRRKHTIPASIARLQLRMRSPSGFATLAQASTCRALLGQWGSLRMDAANPEVPMGLQPAGRETVWRTLQQEGCLD